MTELQFRREIARCESVFKRERISASLLLIESNPPFGSLFAITGVERRARALAKREFSAPKARISPWKDWAIAIIPNQTVRHVSGLQRVIARQDRSEPMASNDDQKVAIIGIGCRFPGADGPQAFWELLREGRCSIGPVPEDRFDIDALYDPTPATPGKVMTRWGGFLPDIRMFDAGCFGISPREAAFLDPQQRLLLKVAWEAMEDAGQPVDELAGSDTGVFVGLCFNDYERLLYRATPDAEFYMTTGTGHYAASGRISYCFDLEGPSLSLDTGCSSCLVAVHLACQSLRAGECSMAIAGGVNVILEPQVTVAFSQLRMLAPDGHCKFGDAEADGYVRSEGAGVVILKPLAQAIADRNFIYAVIAGSAINNDGKDSGSFGRPAASGQERLLRLAYRNAGISPGSVQYVEAHGTGTRAGDPAELNAIGTVLANGRDQGSACLVGSVKTNIGHSEGAAGIAALVKTALALHHRAIPASLHCQEPSPKIPWAELPLQLVRDLTPWPAAPGTGIAGVNAFGISGTNAHVVLTEAPRQDAAAIPAGPGRAVLIPISARSWESVEGLAKAYRDVLGSKDVSLSNLAYSASRHRSHHACRVAITGQNAAELQDQLQSWKIPDAANNEAIGRKVVFVFPGQGAQWLGMGRELMAQEPVFRETLEQCDRSLRGFVNWSLLEQLNSDEDSSSYRLNQIDCLQPTLLAIEIALAQLWRSWGIEPDAVIGHSMGEVGAAFIAGALTLDDAMRVMCSRSELLKSTAGKGAMAVVDLSIPDTELVLAGFEDRLSVAVSNSPTSTVISGDPEAIEEVLQILEERDIFCRPVRVDVASHSPQMDPLKVQLFAALQDLRPRNTAVPIYSTCRAKRIDGCECHAAYWADNLRSPVMFASMIQELLASDHGIFIEMSPHPILLPAIEQGIQHAGRAAVALGSLRRKEPEKAAILRSVARLYELGYALRWDRLTPSGERVKLPRYAWHEERHWYEDDAAPSKASAPTAKLRLKVADPGTAKPNNANRDLIQLMRETEPGEPRNELMRNFLCDEIATVLRSARARISCSQPFKTMGMDSLTTLELRNRLQRGLGLKLSPTVLFNYPNVTALAPRLVEKLPLAIDEPVLAKQEPEAAPPAEIRASESNLDALSMKDLENLLAQELVSAESLLNARE